MTFRKSCIAVTPATVIVIAISLMSPALADVLETGTVNPSVASVGDTTIPVLLEIGNGAAGTVIVNNNSVLTTGTGQGPGTFSIIVGTGAGSNATLTAETGGDVISTTAFGAGLNGGTGMFDINGAGSSLSVGESAFIGSGASANGSGTIRDSATAESLTVILGENATGMGSLKIQNGSTYTTTAPTNFQTLDVGRSGTGELEVSGNSQFTSTGSTAIGSALGGMGTATVTGTGSAFNTGIRTTVGNFGTGALDVLDQATATAQFLEIGSDGGDGKVKVSGAGSTLNVINNNPGFNDAFVRVGGSSGSGPNVGGKLEINDGATVNITAGAGADDATLTISDTSGSTNPSLQGTVSLTNGSTLNITAPNNIPSTNNDAILNLGRDGPGTLTAENSTINVTTTGPSTDEFAGFQIGGSGGTNNAVAVGNATITNSVVTLDAQGGGNSGVSVGRGTTSPNPATAPENTLLIQSGSTFNAIATGTGAGSFSVGRDGARGTATIDGATTTVNVDGFVSIGRDGGHGTLNVQAGAVFNNGTAPADTGFTRVGRGGGTGHLNVNSGGKFNARNLQIGRDALSNGTVNLSGANSEINVKETVQVGRDSVGTLNVGDNPTTGAVESGGTLNAANMLVATNAGSTGTLNISGSTAAVNLTGLRPDINNPGDMDGAALAVRSTGTSVVNINQGAQVLIAPGTPVIAPGNDPSRSSGGLVIGTIGSSPAPDPGTATVNVDGAGTKITISDQNGQAGNTQIGSAGVGTLNITSGAVVDGSDVVTSVVGRATTAIGTVTVDGAGSKWLAGQNLFIGTSIDFGTSMPNGPGGVGKVFVTNAGFVEASEIYVGATGTLGGNGTVKGNVTVDGGTINPGTSPGTLSIEGNFTQLEDSTLLIEIASLADFDSVDITGAADIQGGTLEVVLLDGYIPELDDRFEFLLAAAGFSGDFDAFLFPVFDGLTFNLDADENGVLALVAAPVPIPTALPLFLTALVGLCVVARRRSAPKATV